MRRNRSFPHLLKTPVLLGTLLLLGCDKSTGVNEPVCVDVGPPTAPAPASLWTRLAPAGTPPAEREGHAAGFDGAGDRLVVFGGTSATGLLNDVWVLSNAAASGSSPAWTPLSPASLTGSGPSARSGAIAAYHPGTNRLIVFGGVNASNLLLNDYWVLTNANGTGGTPTWNQLAAPGVPSVRYRSAAAYDSRNNRLIIFGGVVCNSSSQTCTPNNEVWIVSNANGGSGSALTFTRLTPTGTAPSARYSAAVAYDSVANRLIMFGGLSSTAYFTDPAGALDDVWSLSNANGLGGAPAWTQLTVTAPPAARIDHGALFDAAAGRFVIFGGVDRNNNVRSDVHVLVNAGSLQSLAWQRFAPLSSPAASARTRTSVSYSSAHNRMLLFGGGGPGTNRYNDTWTLRLENVVPTTVSVLSAATSLCATNRITLVAVARDASGVALDVPITWSTQNETVLTVDANGIASGIAAGTTSVRACSGSVCSSPLSIQVTAAPTNTPANPGTSPGVALSIPPGQQFLGCVDTQDPSRSSGAATTVLAWGGAPQSGYTWTAASGSAFPPGMTVEPLTGIFKRTSSTSTLVAGTHTLRVTASDGSRTVTGSIPFVVENSGGNVCGSAVFQQSSLSPFPMPAAFAGRPYGASLFVDGIRGVLTWSLATGSLPPGLVIDAARGIVRGTPTSSAAGQTFSFTVRVTDASGQVAICPGSQCPTYRITVQ